LVQADTEELVQENDNLRAECSDLRRQLEHVAEQAHCHNRHNVDEIRGSFEAAEDAHAAAEDAQQEADVLRQEKAALEEAVSELEEQMRDVRLAHRRELRLKAREAAVLKEDLESARSKIRELNVKIRHLQAVRIRLYELNPGMILCQPG
jgi:cell division septum initiation protein DivIVA